MTAWPKQKRAALLEWRGSSQSSSSEQGGSYGQYTRTEAAAPRPDRQQPRWNSTFSAQRPPTLGSGSGLVLGGRGEQIASNRAKGAIGLAASGSGSGARLSPDRPITASWSCCWRPSSRSAVIPFSICCGRSAALNVGHASSYHRVFSRSPWSMWRLGRCLARMARRALRSRGMISSGRRRNGRRASRQEGLRQRPASRCRTFVAFVHGLPLRPQMGRAGGVGPRSRLPVGRGLCQCWWCCTAARTRRSGGTRRRHNSCGKCSRSFCTGFPNGLLSLPATAATAPTNWRARRRGRRRPKRLTLVSRFYADANLYAPPAATARRGRDDHARRERNCRTPEQVVATHAATTAAERGLVRRRPTQRRGRHRHRPLVQSTRRLGRGTCGCSSTTSPARTATNTSSPPTSALRATQVIECFTGRWSIETTFQEMRSYLGLETTRGRKKETVLRVAPCLFGLYTIVAVLYAQMPARYRRTRLIHWVGKTDTTFSDAITCCASLVVARMGFCNPRSYRGLCKTQPAVPRAVAGLVWRRRHRVKKRAEVELRVFAGLDGPGMRAQCLGQARRIPYLRRLQRGNGSRGAGG